MALFARSIASRLIFWVVTVCILFSGLFMTVLISGVYKGFFWIESSILAEDKQRVENAFALELDSLSDLTREYSAWDETYAFMGTGDPGYVDYNMPENWRRRAKIGFIGFLRSDGSVLWARQTTDGTLDDEGAPAAYIGKVFSAARKIAAADAGAGQGIVETDRMPLYFAVEPIVKSDGSGTPDGTLVLGRFLDGERIAGLAEATRTRVLLLSRDQIAGPADGDRPAITRSRDTLSSVFAFSRGSGDSIRFEVIRDRAFWKAGQELLTFIGLSINGINVVLCVALIILLRRIVLKPILLISRHLGQVMDTEDFSRRLHLPAADETGRLAEDINGLFSRIEARTEELRRLNAELERIANIDRLTGLPNRRMLDNHLEREIKRMRRELRGNAYKGYLTILLCDVDFFKLYNDTYGHPAGDACLTAIASAVQSCVHRAEDLACRYGGEEFLIVLPDCGDAGGRKVAENILDAVRALELPHAASKAAPIVTISIGIACREMDESFNIDDQLAEADTALYRAKKEGRNRYASSSGAGSDCAG